MRAGKLPLATSAASLSSAMGSSVMAVGERRPNRAMSSAFSAICGVPNHRATLTEL